MNNEARDFINRGIDLFPQNLVLKDELCYNREIEGRHRRGDQHLQRTDRQNPTPTNTGSHSDGYIRLNCGVRKGNRSIRLCTDLR